METSTESILASGLVFAVAVALSGCADTSKPQTSAARPETAKVDYRSEFDPTYPDAFSARKSPAGVLRDAARANPAKMAKIGTLTVWVPPGVCALKDQCDIERERNATDALRREAAARGGDFVLPMADTRGSPKPPERNPSGEGASKTPNAEIASRAIVYRAGDMALLRRVVMQRVNDALRRAEAAEARAKAAYERAAAARRKLEVIEQGGAPVQKTPDR